jgi:teichuronic acid biosynthesis glycosyltransferase TuaC
MERDRRPRVLVWSSLFPSPRQPQAGIFIRERMFRVGRELPITVIAPQPWFPFQGLIRRFRPGFRVPAPAHEVQQGIDVFRPRFLCVPGILKRLDGLLMAACVLWTVRRLRRQDRVDVIDAHFAYPDGFAATLVARWVRVPCLVTLRGTEVRHSADPVLKPLLLSALHRATFVITVSDSLRRLALSLGIPQDKVMVVGNGVDSTGFAPMDRVEAKAGCGLEPSSKALITVGGLVERKGFHRVIACMPGLLQRHPQLHYLIVGSAGPEGDYSSQLKQQVRDLGLDGRVHFLGSLPPDRVRTVLSAADVSVLATRNEGWANVLLESMGCGVPVVATDVGGNAEVVCRPDLGTIVPFGDHDALLAALDVALSRDWDAASIRQYAVENDWSARVPALVQRLEHVAREFAAPARSTAGPARHA